MAIASLMEPTIAAAADTAIAEKAVAAAIAVFHPDTLTAEVENLALVKQRVAAVTNAYHRGMSIAVMAAVFARADLPVVAAINA